MEKISDLGRRIWTSWQAPSRAQMNAVLYCAGLILLCAGYTQYLECQAKAVDYDGKLLGATINNIFTYLEGSYGALIMVCAGFFAIASAAFGNYRVAVYMLIVSIGAFIVRSVLGTFFKDDNIQA